ncbi:hypothetical protein A33K_12724 [Burkholderia humptydooensis MSMB43]|uniref:Uncharacterized protein n=1 Tax=Burkholderia humptydooensis MSMB43 TaxID=441157 RepID=A0ABN0GA19_9BURK|nr:hypothetical protein A33K_12724 [Burkholderia humptydooensis MSMB43]
MECSRSINQPTGRLIDHFSGRARFAVGATTICRGRDGCAAHERAVRALGRMAGSHLRIPDAPDR